MVVVLHSLASKSVTASVSRYDYVLLSLSMATTERTNGSRWNYCNILPGIILRSTNFQVATSVRELSLQFRHSATSYMSFTGVERMAIFIRQFTRLCYIRAGSTQAAVTGGAKARAPCAGGQAHLAVNRLLL